ncbi:unnamed protein product, partial [Mesorhabditis belari]|uniref:Uncharacterized protein n=1 Tax=Mesorhabditis belari TaxID=2138241 RepID=A0AAF3E912_9BILA
MSTVHTAMMKKIVNGRCPGRDAISKTMPPFAQIGPRLRKDLNPKPLFRLHHFDPMPDDLLVKANYGDAMKDWEYANIPHRDQTPGTIEGHFLWASHKFQKNYKSRINENPFFQRFQSPFFPPTVSHDDEKHETCFIRYWYCEKMPHEMLEWKIYKGFKGAEDEIELQLLFPKEQGLDWKSHCDWKRAAVKLMPQVSKSHGKTFFITIM